MRKSILILLFLIVGIIIIGCVSKVVHTKNVNAKYPISNNSKDIQQHLTIWQNRGEELNPTLIKVEHLGKSDTYVALFENQTGDLGMATLKEGPNKKLQIRNTNYGTNDEKNFANYYGVNTDKGNYGIIIGENPDKQIHSIRAELQNDSLKFSVQVPEDTYFIIVKNLPQGISSSLFADLYLFDKYNKEIKP